MLDRAHIERLASQLKQAIHLAELPPEPIGALIDALAAQALAALSVQQEPHDCIDQYLRELERLGAELAQDGVEQSGGRIKYAARDLRQQFSSLATELRTCQNQLRALGLAAPLAQPGGKEQYSAERVTEVLRAHWLANIECSHARNADRPSCSCSLIDFGWHPTVQSAAEAWIAHVVERLAAPDPAERGEKNG